jgi:hypothetical protein
VYALADSLLKGYVDLRYDLRFDVRFGACVGSTNAMECVVQVCFAYAGPESQVKSHNKRESTRPLNGSTSNTFSVPRCGCTSCSQKQGYKKATERETDHYASEVFLLTSPVFILLYLDPLYCTFFHSLSDPHPDVVLVLIEVIYASNLVFAL